MWDWLKPVAEVLLRFIESPRFVVMVMVICGVVALAPAPWLEAVGAGALRTHYRGWFFIGFLGSSVLSVFELWDYLSAAWKRRVESRDRANKQAGLVERLERLDKTQKMLLFECYREHSADFQVTSRQKERYEAAIGLRLAGLAVRTDKSSADPLLYRLTKEVWEYVRDNPAFLFRDQKAED